MVKSSSKLIYISATGPLTFLAVPENWNIKIFTCGKKRKEKWKYIFIIKRNFDELRFLQAL